MHRGFSFLNTRLHWNPNLTQQLKQKTMKTNNTYGQFPSQRQAQNANKSYKDIWSNAHNDLNV